MLTLKEQLLQDCGPSYALIFGCKNEGGGIVKKLISFLRSSYGLGLDCLPRAHVFRGEKTGSRGL